MNEFYNLDDAESIFFARELESKKARSYDIIRAPLKLFELIPGSFDANPGAESISYEQYDVTGRARIIGDYADDLPRADVIGREFAHKVKTVGTSYGYSVQEIRASAMAGKSLPDRKMAASIRAQREAWNRIGFYGDAANNLPGLLSNPTIVPVQAAASAETGNPRAWVGTAKTGDEIIADLNALANAIVATTNGAEIPDTIALPVNEYAYIASTPRGSGTDTTLLTFFLANNPFIKQVIPANELSAAEIDANFPTNTFTGGVAIAYRRSPEVLTFEMPLFYEQLPPQARNLEWVVPCQSRVAGTFVYYPHAIRFMDSFTA